MPPRPLAALLGVVVVIGLAWALLVPPWQSPDEFEHFAYAQSLAERFALPGDARRNPFSSDQLAAVAAVGANEVPFYLDDRPDWSAADEARWEASIGRNPPSRSNGGGTNSASTNPPLYYLYADLAYWATYPGDTFTRLYAIRIWGVALLALTALGAWLLAGEVLGRRRLPQLVCAAIASLVPMETFISTSVNPDALMVPLWTFALWLGARVIARSGQRRDTVALGAVAAAAILTKATSYALLPAVLLSLAIGWRRRPAEERPAAARALGPALLALALPVLAWVAVATALGRAAVNTIKTGPGARPFNVRQFLSYLWQFYLPRLHSLILLRETTGLPLYDLWVREGWGVFGWREVGMAGWVYGVLAAVTAIIGLGAAALIARFRDRLRLALLAFFGLTFASLLGLLHLTDYRALIAGQPAVIQGRYLLPVIALLGLAGGLLVSRLPARWRGPACGAVLAGMLLLQVLALATVARRYYT